MSLVESLLGAIVRLDGDALVMHVGEKPYVVTTAESASPYRGPLSWGQVELSSRVLTVEAVAGMVSQLLPAELQTQLAQLGAVEYEIPSQTLAPGRFVVIAARGGDDIWLEIRHHRPAPVEAAVAPPAEAAEAPPQVAETASPAEAEPAGIPEPTAPSLEVVAGPESPAEETHVSRDQEVTADEEVLLEFSAAATPEPEEVREDVVYDLSPADLDSSEFPVTLEPVTPVEEAPTPPVEAAEAVAEEVPAPVAAEEPVAPVAAEEPVAPVAEAAVELVAEAAEAVAEEVPAPVAAEEPVAPVAAEEPVAEEVSAPVTAEEPVAPVATAEEAARAAVVLPLTRPQVRAEAPREGVPVQRSTLDRLLRIAAARGASALYIVGASRPVIRVDGEIQVLDAEDTLQSAEVAAMLMELAPEPTRQALQSGVTTEWVSDVVGVGRVRCMSFHDHRGPGGIFRMLPARALSVEQLGLSREIQAFCRESEGLVLVTGPRASGKSTLISAFVDLINRTRADHVITLEGQIKFVHESRRSFVSQRELRGNQDEIVAAARAALREDPDVLVIEDLRSAELVGTALDAAGSGRLVFCALAASGATAALERIIDQFPPERRAHVQTALAANLRGVVAQVLLRKIGGGRVAVREVLLNTPPVAALVSEGRTFQIPRALESGRKLGMVPLNDALMACVTSGAVDAVEAYRRTTDREGLLVLLRREGVDTSFVERLA